MIQYQDRPAVQRFHADAAVPAQVIVVAEPWFEALLQGCERVEVAVGQSRQEAQTDGAVGWEGASR